jgi:hypothetical protein
MLRQSIRTAARTCTRTGRAALGVCVAFGLLGCGRSRVTDLVSPLNVISVCDLFDNLPRYRAQMVAIRGVYYYGALRQDDCSRPFVTGSRRWASALDMVGSHLAAVTGEPVPFRTNQESWDNLDKTCIREGQQGHRVVIWATVVGEVRAPERYVLPSGAVVLGYGHLGALPAEIVIRRVVNVEVKPDPASRYDYTPRKAGPW